MAVWCDEFSGLNPNQCIGKKIWFAKVEGCSGTEHRDQHMQVQGTGMVSQITKIGVGEGVVGSV